MNGAEALVTMVPTNPNRWAPMQPKSRRRVHGAEFKAQVLAECEQPGASVAAVALVHGLNVNLVRKWLVGRGLKRTGLEAPRTVTRTAPGVGDPAPAALQFVPVELAPAASASTPDETVPPVALPSGTLPPPIKSEVVVALRSTAGARQTLFLQQIDAATATLATEKVRQ